MKLLQFRHIFLIIFFTISAITYVVYSAILFTDNHDSNIWYGPLHNTYNDSNAVVTKDNDLQNPFVCDPTAVIVCGDSIVQGSEQCDQLENNQTGLPSGKFCGACKLKDIGLGLSCGDGVIDTINSETCDDGGQNGNPGKCNTTCDGNMPICGNNIKEGTELCDGTDAAVYIGQPNYAQCYECQPFYYCINGNNCGAGYCGDGIKNIPAEKCDDGAGNSDTNPGACKLDCQGKVPNPTCTECDCPGYPACGITPPPCTSCNCDSSLCPIVTPPALNTNGDESESFGI